MKEVNTLERHRLKDRTLSFISQGMMAIARRRPDIFMGLFAPILDNFPIGVYCTDLQNHEVIFANSVFTEMFGCKSLRELEDFYRRDELYLHSNDRVGWLQRVSESGNLLPFVVQLKKTDGTTFWASDTAAYVVYNKRGNPKSGIKLIFGFLEDVTLQEKEKKRLEYEANRDSLTNLYNRRYFQAKGQEIFEEAQTNGLPLSLIMFDIDHFKSANDKWGHPVGDKILKRITAIISSTMKEDDLFARYGGG